ncbi:MAG: hypothetical protein AB7V22_05310 [Kiritimatiellia bacterium]
MNTWKWLQAVLVGTLAVAVSCATIGCDDDDDDDSSAGTTTVVVTNVVNGTTVVVTNVVPATPTLVAPQLVAPANGWKTEVLLLMGNGYDTTFEWTAVPGAAAYVFELNGVETLLTGTTTSRELGYGDYEWRVWARDANGANGPKSAKFSFSINVMLFQAI